MTSSLEFVSKCPSQVGPSQPLPSQARPSWVEGNKLPPTLTGWSFQDLPNAPARPSYVTEFVTAVISNVIDQSTSPRSAVCP